MIDLDPTAPGTMSPPAFCGTPSTRLGWQCSGFTSNAIYAESPFRRQGPVSRTVRTRHCCLPYRFTPHCAISDADYEEVRSFTWDPPRPYLTEDRVVKVRLPLGVRLKEVEDDETGADVVVYVAEVVPGGNAESTGDVRPGDIVTGCSVPLGDSLAVVGGATGRGLSFVESQVKTRDETEEFFFLSLRPYNGGMAKIVSRENAKAKAALKTSIDWQETMAGIKSPKTFPLISEEAMNNMRDNEEQMLRSSQPEIPEETADLEDDPLFRVSNDLKKQLENRVRKLQEGMEDADYDDL